MITVEFNEKLQNATNIESLLKLRKEVKSTRYMSDIYKRLVVTAKNEGYAMKECSYAAAKTLIGTAYPMSRKQNFAVSKSRVFKEFNGKTIADAIVIYSDGRGTVTLIIKS